ncbi:response regulator [Lysobacter sp. S4-A87]|uniref:response regulator n=1 Tax=Lysobacter sp. S4-A87 TaxID=2925843 RepID=UPI001F52CE97|nr:response regulator [Lysobacter sp. S4-A87]UNK48951.1 response regulator [Lysobacter sp. S4-A87]
MGSAADPNADALCIILVEDDADDAELVSLQLTDAGIRARFVHVQSASELRAAMLAGADLVVSDVSMPAFSGFDALDIVREFEPAIPFVLVSGAFEEDVAARATASRVQAYLLKDDLHGMVRAVQQAQSKSPSRREAAGGCERPALDT